MKNFTELNVGDFFTLSPNQKANPPPALWRKKSKRTARLVTNGSSHRWFYFRKSEFVYEVKQ